MSSFQQIRVSRLSAATVLKLHMLGYSIALGLLLLVIQLFSLTGTIPIPGHGLFLTCIVLLAKALFVGMISGILVGVYLGLFSVVGLRLYAWLRPITLTVQSMRDDPQTDPVPVATQSALRRIVVRRLGAWSVYKIQIVGQVLSLIVTSGLSVIVRWFYPDFQLGLFLAGAGDGAGSLLSQLLKSLAASLALLSVPVIGLGLYSLVRPITLTYLPQGSDNTPAAGPQPAADVASD